MVLDRSRESKPLYLQIKDILKQKIINNEYTVGSTIPSENELEEIKFEDLPEDWVCPLCGVGKDMFEKVEE